VRIPTTQRLYLIEAPNITPPKVAKEMAEEKYRFLVSDGDEPGWMKKHFLRYQAIIDDISILNICTNMDLTGSISRKKLSKCSKYSRSGIQKLDTCLYRAFVFYGEGSSIFFFTPAKPVEEFKWLRGFLL
jgi:hypothetical protein